MLLRATNYGLRVTRVRLTIQPKKSIFYFEFLNSKFIKIMILPFGLEISDSSLKIASLKKKRNDFFIETLFQKNLSPQIIVQDEIKNEKELEKNLKEALKEAKIKSKYVNLSLPDNKVFLKIVQMPKMSEKELKEAIQWETEQHLPLSIDQVYLDYQILFNNPAVEKGQIGILVCASPKNFIDPYINFLKKNNLIPFSFEPASQSIVRTLINEKEIKDKAILIINLKKEKGSLIVYDFGTLQNIFSISLLPANKQAQAGLSVEQTNFLDSLTENINESLNFYKSHFEKAHSISKSILCGEKENLKEIALSLKEKLSFPIELANPFINFSSQQKTSEKEGLKFVIPIGLAFKNYAYS